ncbi:MAG: hypothetical protein R2861_10320 [Desulfobacterales bacterium]
MIQVLEPLNPHHAGHCPGCGTSGGIREISPGPMAEACRKIYRPISTCDNCGDHDSHLGMGKGNIDFVPLLDFIRSMTIKPVITLEPHQKKIFWQAWSFWSKLISFRYFPDLRPLK